jgi:thioredoxin reductase (NADPH)
MVIIGSGPAGLTAALYAARATLSPVVFEGFMAGGIAGGQLMTTGVVENFPGFTNGISGPELMVNMREQAKKFGARLLGEDVDEVAMGSRPFQVVSSGGKTYEADSLIFALGATARRLALDSERRFWGRGISTCAVCDGALPIFRNKPLAVLGGGDSACEEALHLANFGSKIFLIHRRDELRASKIMQERVKRHPKVEILWNKTVTEFVGEKLLSGITLKDTVTGKTATLEISGAFEAIGHQPNTGFLKGQIALSESGYIVTNPHSCSTSVPGAFAAGDVKDEKFHQAVIAAGSGALAAIEAEQWLQGKV